MKCKKKSIVVGYLVKQFTSSRERAEKNSFVNYENESIENERGKHNTARHKIARSF
jgi:hypothetical protein